MICPRPRGPLAPGPSSPHGRARTEWGQDARELPRVRPSPRTFRLGDQAGWLSPSPYSMHQRTRISNVPSFSFFPRAIGRRTLPSPGSPLLATTGARGGSSAAVARLACMNLCGILGRVHAQLYHILTVCRGRARSMHPPRRAAFHRTPAGKKWTSVGTTPRARCPVIRRTQRRRDRALPPYVLAGMSDEA